MRVQCLAQEHNTMSLLNPQTSALIMSALHPHNRHDTPGFHPCMMHEVISSAPWMGC